MLKQSLILLSIGVLLGCKKDPKTIQENPNTNSNTFELTGDVNFRVDNIVGASPLTLNSTQYVNENLDTFSVSIFKYYISNIKLKRDDGFEFVEPESYRLFDQADSTTRNFTINNVPLGNYISMEFIIGVDSARNCSGAQAGALDISKDMFWDWAQGYIFAKMEGVSSSVVGGNFAHHIGGFTGQWNAIRKSTPSFGSNMIQVVEGHTPKVYMKADILEWFKNPDVIDLASYVNIAMGKKASQIASNYSDMFSITAIQN